MIQIPTMRGVIRRRILVNVRIDAAVAQRQLPAPFRPKLLGHEAVAGICLIRLEQLRPAFLPFPIGLASENAAHRIAVEWEDDEGNTREGVYIRRRDSNSPVNRLLGGRLVPGEQNAAQFSVNESPDTINLAMRSADGQVAVELRGTCAEALPSTSLFPSLAAASAFFAAGSIGYSARTRDQDIDGLMLATRNWKVEPLAVEHMHSSYFADESLFPPGSITFDCALLMRNIEHEWHSLPPLSARA